MIHVLPYLLKNKFITCHIVNIGAKEHQLHVNSALIMLLEDYLSYLYISSVA